WLATARARVFAGGVAHLPVLALGGHRLAGMGSATVLNVSPVVRVAHQCAAVPTDLAEDTASVSHCRCTSRSVAVGISPAGAKHREGAGSSSASGVPPPRATRSTMTAPVTKTTITSTAKTIDSVPWMNVLRMTWLS